MKKACVGFSCIDMYTWTDSFWFCAVSPGGSDFPIGIKGNMPLQSPSDLCTEFTLLASSPLPANSSDSPLLLLLLILLQLGSTFNFSKSFHIHFLIWPFQQSCEVGRASTIIPIWKMGEMKYNALKWWALSDVSHSQLGPGLNLGSPMALHGESLCWIFVYRHMYLADSFCLLVENFPVDEEWLSPRPPHFLFLIVIPINNILCFLSSPSVICTQQ